MMRKGTTAAEDNKYTAPALEKGLDIIDVLSSQEHGLTQVEIARSLQRSVSEIYRMLVVLRRRGIVDLEEGGERYFLTTRLFEMVNRTPIIARLTTAAGPVMTRLAKSIDESVHLAILSEDAVLVIGQIDNPGNNIMSVRLGTRVEAWRTSSGRVLLANQPEEWLAEFLKTYPHPDGVPGAQLRRELAATCKRRYEQMPSYIVKGVTNISAPIIGYAGSAIAALNIPYVERYFGSVPIETCRARLLEAAAQISQAIGGPLRPANGAQNLP